MLNPYRFFSERLARINAKFDWLGALFARLTLGLEFLGTGYGKLTHHEKVAAYFADLGLLTAGVQAWLVGGLEFMRRRAAGVGPVDPGRCAATRGDHGCGHCDGQNG